MKKIKQSVAVFLTIIMLSTLAPAAYAAANTNTVFPQPTAALKKAIPALAGNDVGKILKLAEKYYKLALSKASIQEKGYINAAVYWKPDFSGKTKNAALAAQLTYPSAFLAAYTDLKGLYLTLNAAVLALDARNPTYAGNLASSIAAYEEDTVKKPLGSVIKLKGVQSYAGDAAVVYEYALSLKLTGKTMDVSIMPLLLNYGYLCIDMGKLAYAKLVFETATKLVPGYLPAKEGMAAYWLATGDKKKAQKALEGALLPMIYKEIKKSGDDSSDKKAPQVEADDSIATMEQKLETLRKAPTVIATDFYSDLDPVGTAKVRNFVDNIAKQWKFYCPGYEYLSEFSTLAAFRSGSGQAAYEAFQSELKSYSEKFVKALNNSQQDLLEGTGLDISVGGVDLSDIMKNPEKYKDADLGDNVSISGLDDLMKQAQQAQSDLQKGDASGALSLGASVDPALAILRMNPGDYANPTDVITQKYNTTILLRKINGYKNYFYKQNKDLVDILTDDAKKATSGMNEFSKNMDEELQKLEDEYTAHLINEDQYKIKKHAIHQKYDPQMNQLAETTFADATNYVSSLYKNRIRQNIEAMYADCMKNCMLISDPKVRKVKEDGIKADVYQAVFQFMSNVATAYGLGDGSYPYHCDCSEAEVEAAREREQKAYEEKEAEKTAMENKARKEFEQGVIKESSQLYQRLDKYSAEYNLAFMHAKWHPLKTELTFNVKVPLKNSDIGATFKMVQEHIRNTTTYGGGLSAAVKGKVGKAEVSGSVSLQGEMTTDGNGNVVRGDFAGNIIGTASLGSFEASAKYDASVMRGCKLSAEVTKLTGDTLKPPNAVDAWDDYTDTTGVFLPEKPKKVLWSGEYQVSK